MKDQTFDEFWAAEGGTEAAFTTAKGDSSNLTFEKLRETIEEIRKPKLYYAVCEFITQGDIYWIEANDFHPLRVAVHPDDLERLKDELRPYRTLLPIADYQPAVAWLRPMLGDNINEWMRGRPEAEVYKLRRKIEDVLGGG